VRDIDALEQDAETTAPQETADKRQQTSQEHTVRLSGPLAVEPATSETFNPFAKLSSFQPTERPEASETNPWLAVGDASGSSLKVSRKKDGKAPTRDDAATEKVAAKTDKQASKSAEARKAATDDAQVAVDPENVLGKKGSGAAATTSGSGGAEKKRKPRSKKMNGTAAAAGLEAAAEEIAAAQSSSDEEAVDEPVRVPVGQPAAFKQRDLVARAFANDNVVAVSLRVDVWDMRSEE
jgi:U3 small nucleolar RNA-associated protein 14